VLKTIRSRLLAYYVVVLGGTLGACGLVIGAILQRSLERQLDATLATHLRWTQGALEWEDGEATLEWYARAGPAEDDPGVLWQVSSPDGAPIEGGSPGGQRPFRLRPTAQPPPEFPRVSYSDEAIPGFAGRYRVAASHLPVYPEEGTSVPVAHVVAVAAVSRASVDAAIGTTRVALFVVLPFAGLAAAAGGYVLLGRAMRPVRAIAETAERISERSLSQRVASSGPDELGALARVINGMLGRLEAQFERQRRFTADAAHELRTPLAVLRTGLDVALGQRLAPETQDALRSCVTTVDRMGRLVERLLFLARADAPDARSGFETIGAATLAESLKACCASLGGNVVITTQCDRGFQCALSVDLELLRGLVRNLVQNALVHAGPAPRVEVSFRCDDEAFRIEVTDDGPGVPEEHRPHVFDRFYRVDDVRSSGHESAGLGLAICAAVADLHGGSIRYEPRPDGGSRFAVILPHSRCAPSSCASPWSTPMCPPRAHS